jgi:hypothetical protein
MKKNIIITILATSVILFTILAIIGMNMEDKTTTAIVDNAGRDTFIKSCISDNANYAYCACGYDYLEREYGFDGMIKIFEKITDTNMPDEVMETYNYCKYLNK